MSSIMKMPRPWEELVGLIIHWLKASMVAELDKPLLFSYYYRNW
jgi:hypothetical protein